MKKEFTEAKGLRLRGSKTPPVIFFLCLKSNAIATICDIQVVGGATLVSNLMNESLIDELHLLVNPFILGGGKALFKDVKERHALKLVKAKPLKSGKVSLIYSIHP